MDPQFEHSERQSETNAGRTTPVNTESIAQSLRDNRARDAADSWAATEPARWGVRQAALRAVARMQVIADARADADNVRSETFWQELTRAGESRTRWADSVRIAWSMPAT